METRSVLDQPRMPGVQLGPGAAWVLLRRLHALVIADNQGHWEMACLLEEVPSAKTLQVHEVVVKDLTNMAGLITKAHDTGKDKTPGLEEE